MNEGDQSRVNVALIRLDASRPHLVDCHPYGLAQELMVQAIDIVGLEKAALLFATAVTEIQRDIDVGARRRHQGVSNGR